MAPAKAGCYLWKAENNEILYIGKALNLKNRLKSYLLKKQDNIKTMFLMTKVFDVEWIQTDTEVEALLLEANLVGKHKPKYNVRLKDDKSFPWICVSTSEMYPRVFLTRETKNKNETYFGPFTDVRAARSNINLIHKIFPVRKVKQKLPLKKPGKPCMNFHIKRCLGPCQGNVEPSEYKQIIDQILLFLEGKTQALEEKIIEKMKALSREEKFEFAAIYRDTLHEIRKTIESQHVHSLTGGDEDLLALALKQKQGQIVLLEFRNGKMIARKSFPLAGLENANPAEIFISFIRDHYLNSRAVAAKIVLEVTMAPTEKKILENALLQIHQKKIRIITGRSKNHRSILKLAKKNAELLLGEKILSARLGDRRSAVLDLQKMLKLNDEPQVIECFDISHFQGKQTVASGVVFLDGVPHTSGYRRYNIKSVAGIDDPASIREVVSRRIQRLLNEQKALPDLILIDGGITQLTAACEAAISLGLENLPVISIAKKLEEIYIPGEAYPVRFDKGRSGMRLLLQLRDEAHRFAISFHRQKRNKDMLKSAIQNIPDIGKSRKQNLLKHFSGRKLHELTLDELCQVPGIGKKLAQKIYDFLAPD